MKNFKIIFCLMLFHSILVAQHECDLDHSNMGNIPLRAPCDNAIDHFQNAPLTMHSVPEKHVNLMLHIVGDENGEQNFQPIQSDIDKIFQVIDHVNDLYSNVRIQNPLGTCNPASVHVPDSKIRFNINDLRFYQDQQYYCSDTKAIHSQLYSHFVTNNSDLSQNEKENNLHVIIVAFRGGDLLPNDGCRCNCDNPFTQHGGQGLRDSDYSAVRGYYYTDDTESIAGHLSHELGHTLGLRHSWADGGEGVCDTGGNVGQSNNIMDYSTYEAFTQRQIAKMHYWIENREGDIQPYISNDLCDKQEDEILIAHFRDIHWDSHEIVSQDIHVYGTLELSCEVEMANNTKIYVHQGGILNINGGYIKSYCGGEWQGIIVEGNGVDQGPTAGRVIVNNGIIENAKIGITTRPRRSWDPSFHGGLVQVDNNSSFLNCDIGIAFYKYTGQQNSSINATSFSNLNRAITSWANDVIPITQSTFTNIADRAIMTWDAPVSVTNGCVFENCANYGIQMHHTIQPLIPSVIGAQSLPHNEFDDCGTAIRSTGAAGILSDVIITNNSFSQNDQGVHMDGINRYSFSNNFSNGDLLGINQRSNGLSFNQCDDNDFSGSVFSLLSQGENGNFTFERNCFDNPVARDAVLFGTVASAQGNQTSAASNCFSINAISDLFANTNVFDYYTPFDSNADECLTPDHTGTYTILSQSQNDDYSLCGLTNFGGNGNNGTYIVNQCVGVLSHHTIPQLLSFLQNINSEMNGIQEVNQAARVSKEQLEKCKSEIIRFLLIFYHGENNYSQMFTLLSTQSEFHYQAQAFSVLTQTGEYAPALQYLNELATSNEGESDYKLIQQINMERWMNAEEFKFGADRQNVIRNIAQKDHPYSAYAHSLLNLMTGEDIEYPFPEVFENERSEGRSKQNVKEIIIYPNPTHGFINVTADGSDSLLGKSLYIMDYLGNRVLETTISELHERVDISSFSNGVYIVVIHDDHKVIKKEVLLKVY